MGCFHVWTAWRALREVLWGGVEIVSFVRTCVLCGRVENHRGERMAA